MKNIIVLMTALVPTTGHADLIRFAASIPESKVHVLINGRSFEPVSTDKRVESLQNHFHNFSNVIVKGSVVDDAPQNPESMPEGFWEWWRDEINNNFPEAEKRWDYVVASEPYGLNVAKSLNADFVPYDIGRTINPISGTCARKNINDNWHDIIPEFRQYLIHNVVMFGQESVGKTTLSKTVAEELDAVYVMEFARPYLESVGSEVTDEKMNTICFGQAGMQKSITKSAKTPVTVFDTDLFSTVGYYRIYNEKETRQCRYFAEESKADTYYVLPDSIPFVEDELRYGGHERESNTQFWVDLLEEFNLNYVIVPDGSIKEKTDFIVKDILKNLENKYYSIITFERD